MNSQLIPHRISESMKHTLYNSLNSNGLSNSDHQATIDISHSNYLLNSEGSKQTMVYLFNEDFTDISKIVSIPSIVPGSCLVQIEKPSFRNIIACVGGQILLYSIPKSLGQTKLVAQPPQRIKIFNGGQDQIVYLSAPLSLPEFDFIIGYSKQNQFCLIILKQCSKAYRLQACILKNLDKPHPALRWFLEHKNQNYRRIKLFPLRMDWHDNFFRLLSVRDNQIMLHVININPESNKSTIKVVNTANTVSHVISATSHLKATILICNKDEIEPKQVQIIVAYQVNIGYIILLKLQVHFNQQDPFQASVIAENISSKSFSMAYSCSNLYYVNAGRQDQFRLMRSQKYQQLTNHEQLIGFQQINLFNDPVFFSQSISQGLYLVTMSQLFLIESEESFQSDISQIHQKWLRFRQKMLKQHQIQIQQLLRQQKYASAIDLLTENQRRMINWMKHKPLNSNADELQLKQLITTELICSIILQKLVEIHSRNIIQLKQTVTQTEIVQLSQNCCDSEAAVQFVNRLIDTDIKSVQLVVSILSAIYNLEKQQINTDTVGELLMDTTLKCLQKLKPRTDSESVNMLKEVLSYSICFMSPTKSDLEDLIQKNQQSFVKQFIMHNLLENMFVHFFTTSQLKFNKDDLKQLSHQLHKSSQSRFISFGRRLLIECKEQCKKNEKFIGETIDVLVEGLIDLYQQIVADLNEIFPGLCFFFYLLSGSRRKGAHFIRQFAKRCQHSQSTYIMFLSIVDEAHTNQSEITLQNICRSLQIGYQSIHGIQVQAKINDQKQFKRNAGQMSNQIHPLSKKVKLN